MNLVITECPTTSRPAATSTPTWTPARASSRWTRPHRRPDLTVTLDYETAKAILVEQNPQAGMQAFMAGKIKVQGDMTKLMAMQSGPPDPAAAEVAEKITEITE